MSQASSLKPQALIANLMRRAAGRKSAKTISRQKRDARRAFLENLEPRLLMSGQGFSDDFNGTAIDSNIWDVTHVGGQDYGGDATLNGGNLDLALSSRMITSPVNYAPAVLAAAPAGDFTATMKVTFDRYNNPNNYDPDYELPGHDWWAHDAYNINTGLPNIGIGVFSSDMHTFVKADYEVDPWGWEQWSTRDGGQQSSDSGIRMLHGDVTADGWYDQMFGSDGFHGQAVNFGSDAFYLQVSRTAQPNGSQLFEFSYSTDNVTFTKMSSCSYTSSDSTFNATLDSLGITFYGAWGHAQPDAFVDYVDVVAAPTGLTASAGSNGEVSLSWSNNNAAAMNATFEIQRSTTSDFSAGVTTIPVGVNATTFTDENPVECTVNYYRILAVAPHGEKSAYSSPASASVALKAPTGLTASASSDSQIGLSWTNNSQSQTGFEILRADNANFTNATTVATVTTTTYNDPNLTEGTTYYYRVRAVSLAASSGYSNDSSATTLLYSSEANVDVDVDSDNNNGYGLPDRSANEDSIEELATDSSPGKVLLVNNMDKDQDGIPGYADGFNLDSQASEDDTDTASFVPLVIHLEGYTNTDLVSISYSASDPLGVSITYSDPYTLPEGQIRLWRVDGSSPRNPSSLSDGGDYIEPGSYSPSQLGLSDGDVVLFVEAVRPSVSVGDISVTVNMLDQGQNLLTSDMVRFTASQVEVSAEDYAGNVMTDVGGLVCSSLEQSPEMTFGFTEGAMLKYTVHVRDPRQSLTQMHVGACDLPLVHVSDEWQSASFTIASSDQAINWQPAQTLVLDGDSISMSYNPNWLFWKSNEPADSVLKRTGGK